MLEKKISDAKMGEKNPNFGNQFSKETIEKMSESKKGEKNPNYSDGRSLLSFEESFELILCEWKKLAQEIRKRDKFICQYCGEYPSTDVHHIIPRRIKINNSSDNLITLCGSCHRKVESLTSKYLEKEKNPIEIFYQKWNDD